ncbi:MAG TPA: SbcC/MukB-like Walker B domain-containing protein, partial [Miltoncostaeaceae bacterium]|nr:SbcC/MukB-like Walker B domain-containing protein [Miltoncostaeaceae bacterium]
APPRAALAALVPRVEGVRQAHRVHERALTRSRGQQQAVERLPSPHALIDLGERLARADAGAAAARERRAQADRWAEDADRALRAARERHGGTVAQLSALVADAARDMQLAAREPELRLQSEAVGRDLERIGADLSARDGLRRRVQAHAAWVQARAALARAQERMDADRAAAARAHTDLAAAQAAHAAARSAREAARRADLAAALRVGLEVGDACPVCGSTVAHLPHGESRVAAAEDEVRTLRAAAEAREQEHARALASGALADEAHSEAAATLAQAERELVAAGGAVGDDREALARELERLDTAAAEHARLQERAAGHQRERESVARERATLAERLGRWAGDPDAVETLRRAADELAALDERAISAATAARAAAGDADRARTALEDLTQRELVPIAQAAGLVAHLTDLPAPAPGASAAQVIGATRELTLAVQGVLSAARDDAATAAGALEELRAHLAADARPLGVESLNAIVPAVQRAQRELDVRRSGLSDLVAAARQARLLADRAEEARRRAERHRQVAADLRVDRFPRFLLQRYLTRLAAGASRRLETLSGGAYRFAHADRDPLTVVDVRRGERLRAAGTLSGGERFLASLALALGLADIAAESGGRLECLFLDEGFSTLDADSLEQALEGIERLADDGRLVGVITHLPGVAERLGAAIEVRKDPAGVSRIGPHTAVETPVGG